MYLPRSIDAHLRIIAMRRVLQRHSGFAGRPCVLRVILNHEGFTDHEITAYSAIAASWEAMRRQLFEMKEAA